MTDSDRFVSYPLSDRFTLRAGAGRASRRVRGLAGASDWRREALDRVGSVLVATAGTRRLSPVRAWSWPACEPVDLVEALQDHLPGLSILGAAAPRQSGRARLSVLAEWRHHDIVVKLGRPDDGIDTEAEVLRLLSDDPLPGIATPRVLAAGELSRRGSDRVPRDVGARCATAPGDRRTVAYLRDRPCDAPVVAAQAAGHTRRGDPDARAT